MRPVEELTSAELTEENKALEAKKREIAARQAVISAEVGIRAKRARADRQIAGLSEAEIDELPSAIARKRARKELAKLEAKQ